MTRVDVIANTILGNSRRGAGALAELIDNAIVEQIDAQVGTAYNLGHDEGWDEGFDEGKSEGYMRGFDEGGGGFQK
jgi:hypothetical protein